MSSAEKTRGGAGARRRRLLWTALPAAVVLAAAARLLSLAPVGAAAEGAFTDKDAPALAAAADWLGTVNFFEPYKADFAKGDAQVLRGDFAAARTAFETALRGAPEAEGCRIRVNLVLSIERLGDGRRGAGDDAAARTLYQDGQSVIKDAPQGCFQDGSQGNAEGEGDALSDARERFEAKAGERGGKGEDAGERQAADPAAQEQLQQLEESARKARQERLESEQRGEYLRNPEPDVTVERPW